MNVKVGPLFKMLRYFRVNLCKKIAVNVFAIFEKYANLKYTYIFYRNTVHPLFLFVFVRLFQPGYNLLPCFDELKPKKKKRKNIRATEIHGHESTNRPANNIIVREISLANHNHF